jgi:hypothetical protein
MTATTLRLIAMVAALSSVLAVSQGQVKAKASRHVEHKSIGHSLAAAPVVGKWVSQAAAPIGGKVDGGMRIQDIDRLAELTVNSDRNFLFRYGWTMSGSWRKESSGYLFHFYDRPGLHDVQFKATLSKDGRTLTLRGTASHPLWNGETKAVLVRL